MKRDKSSHYEGNLRPGMGYVVWKMQGFPEGGLSMGEHSTRGVISKCTRCRAKFFPKGNETICRDHEWYGDKD